MSTTLLVDPPPVATAPPASRASWSGQLRLGSCCVPVKAYPTISSTPGVSLRQLHGGCGEHIEYHKCCPKHGRVQADQIVKGYWTASIRPILVVTFPTDGLTPLPLISTCSFVR